MKKSRLLLLLAFLSIFLFSCDPNTCRNIQCGEFGICDEGECYCEDAYEKDDNGLCNTLMRDKVLGSWSATNSCDTLNNSDSLNVLESATALNAILIRDLAGFSADIEGTIEGADLNIERQSPDNNSIYIEGSGEYDWDTEAVYWDVVITDESQNPVLVDSCSLVWE